MIRKLCHLANRWPVLLGLLMLAALPVATVLVLAIAIFGPYAKGWEGYDAPEVYE